MAYTQTRFGVVLVSAGDGTSTSTAGRYFSITRKFILRRVGLMVNVAGTTTAGILTVKKRVTPASDTNGTTIGTLTLPSATSVAGIAVYLDDLSTEFDFGDELYVVVSTAMGGSGKIDVAAEIEDLPGNPDSSSNVTEVTA